MEGPQVEALLSYDQPAACLGLNAPPSTMCATLPLSSCFGNRFSLAGSTAPADRVDTGEGADAVLRSRSTSVLG